MILRNCWRVELSILVALVAANPARSGNISFDEHVLTTTSIGARSIVAADFDDDGDTDIAVASAFDSTVRWFESDGADPPDFTAHVISTITGGTSHIVAVDVDGDSDIDLISADCLDDTITLLENDGNYPAAFEGRIIGSGANGPWSVGSGDIDGDGDIDLLSASQYDDRIAWYENDGAQPANFTAHVITVDPDENKAGEEGFANGARSVDAADLDGDGDIDVISGSKENDRVAWYENDGAVPPSFTPRVISDNANNVRCVRTADVDGDGDIDVLSASSIDGKVAWYENDGGQPAQFTERIISANISGARYVHTVDLDDDGDLDVISSSIQGSIITWFESDGSIDPAFTPRAIATGATGDCWAVSSGDVDDNGIVDVLAVFQTDDMATWYQNLTPPPATFDMLAASSCIVHNDGGPNETLMCIDLAASNGVEPRQFGPKQIIVETSADLDDATLIPANVQMTCVNQSPGALLVGPIDATSFHVDFDFAVADIDCCTLAFDGVQSLSGADLVGEVTLVALQGDLDFNGGVTGGDALIIKVHFGESLAAGDLVEPRWDFNRDGGVSGGDFSLVKPLFNHIAPDCP